jgi:hypothetical protein
MKLPLPLLCAALAACGPKPDGTGPGGADRPFENLDHDERITFMKRVVVPTMQPLFADHDPKFGNFGCRTCHGPGADEGRYTMPNEDLPKLGGNLTTKFDRRKLDFMLMEVKPTMAKLLGVPEWSPQAPQGFDCYACHDRE